MKKGGIYTVKIIEIKHCAKEIPGPKTCKHKLKLENQAGDSITVEYLSEEKQVSSNIFCEGTWQQVKCTNTHQFGNTVEPYDEEAESKRMQPAEPQNTSLPKPFIEKQIGEPKEKNAASLNISSKNITFATAYAKDLMVAEIAHWSEGREVTVGDVDRMMKLAYAIEDKIADRMNF